MPVSHLDIACRVMYSILARSSCFSPAAFLYSEILIPMLWGSNTCASLPPRSASEARFLNIIIDSAVKNVKQYFVARIRLLIVYLQQGAASAHAAYPLPIKSIFHPPAFSNEIRNFDNLNLQKTKKSTRSRLKFSSVPIQKSDSIMRALRASPCPVSKLGA